MSLIENLGSGISRVWDKIGGGAEKKQISEDKPVLSQDMVTLGGKADAPLVEISKGFVQNEGVVEKSSAVVEKAPTEEKPKKAADEKVVSKEVKLKSGVTITEDVEKGVVTISQNVNGMPKNFAVFEDAHLTLPRDSNEGYYPLIHKAPFVDEVTSATPKDIVIEGPKLREIINVDNGTITLEDKTRGAQESPPAPFMKAPITFFQPVRGPLSPSMWFGDKYVISPQGDVKGTQFEKVIEPSPFPQEPKETIVAKDVKGAEFGSGAIAVEKGGQEFLLVPFVSRKDIIQ